MTEKKTSLSERFAEIRKKHSTKKPVETPEEKAKAEVQAQMLDMQLGFIGQSLQDAEQQRKEFAEGYKQRNPDATIGKVGEKVLYGTKEPRSTVIRTPQGEVSLDPNNPLAQSILGADEAEVERTAQGAANRKKVSEIFGDPTVTDYSSQAIRTAFDYVEELPKNERGEIEVGGIAYTPTEVAQSLVPHVTDIMSGKLFGANAKYRDDWARSMGYDGIEGYLAAMDERLAALQNKMKGLADKSVERRATRGFVAPHAMAQEDAIGMKAVRDARDQIAAMRNGSWQLGQGFVEGFDLRNALSGGLTGVVGEVGERQLKNKIKDGKELTPAEQLQLDVIDIQSELDMLDDARGVSFWRNTGRYLGSTAEVMSQMAMTMPLARGMVKPLELGIKVAWDTTKKAGRKSIARGIGQGIFEGLKITGKGLANLGQYALAGTLLSPLQPSTYSRFLEKRNAQYSYHNGKLEYMPTNAWEDFINTTIEQGAELSSELFGIKLAEVMGMTLKGLGRIIGLQKMSRKTGLFNVEASKIFGWKKPQSLRYMEQNLGFSGDFISEGVSESWGDFSAELLKSVVTGDGHFEEFKNPSFWATTFAVSGIFGGAMSMASYASGYRGYLRDMRNLGKKKADALSHISHTNLKNALISLSSGDSIADATKALAELDWSAYDMTERGYAMDYLRAEAMQQVIMGENTESARLVEFGHKAAVLENLAYKGTKNIVYVQDTEGNIYYLLDGNVKDKEAMLTVMTVEGKKMPLHAEKVQGVSPMSITDATTQMYQSSFNVGVAMDRLDDATETMMNMENPSVEEIRNVAKTIGITIPDVGGVITLVDGRQMIVESVNSNIGIIASYANEAGEMEMVQVHVDHILSNDANIAEAQRLQMANNALEVTEAALDAETIESGDTGEGAIVTLPNGNKGTIVGCNEDGTVMVDVNPNSRGRVAEMAIETYTREEIEAANPTPAIPEATATEGEDAISAEMEATANAVVEAKPIPMKDGEVDYDAITDVEQFAEVFTSEMGDREAAANAVVAMRDGLVAEMTANVQRENEAKTPNDIIRLRKENKRLAERIAFYDKVINKMLPEESVKEDSIATPTYGLEENELSEQLTPEVRELLDNVAIGLGVHVVFEEEVRTDTGAYANADINGNKVRIAWRNRDKALSFLIGHEFTHRMQDISPETYAKLKDAVKAYVGEARWNQYLGAMIATYEAAGYTIVEESTKEAKDAPRRKEVSITTIEDEIIADEIGKVVEDENAFKAFVSSEDVREKRTVLEAIKAFLENLIAKFRGIPKKVAQYENMTAILDTLIMESVKIGKTAKEAAETTGNDQRERYSLSTAPAFYSNAEYAVRNIKQEKATPEQWLKMIEKNGGLKAGEDKWLGLSDWLKASDKKTLTKDEVLQYIAENDIQIEEVQYSETNTELLDRVSELTNDLYYIDESINSLSESIVRGKQRLKTLTDAKKVFDEKAEALKQEYGEDSPEYQNHIFYDSYTDDIESLEASIAQDEEYYNTQSERADALRSELEELNEEVGDEREINSTRLDYTTKGLENKREIALVVPTIEPWNTSDNVHFGDAGEGRAVAWIRFGETTDTDGKRVLVIDEIQSKRHQDGREKGYSNRSVSQQELYEAQEAAFSKVIDYESALADKYGEDEWAALATAEEMAEYERLRALDEAATNAYENYDKGVPSAPFEKNWAELAMKRMLRYAAENGYDYVAWTTGDQQAERYNIGNVIERVVSYPVDDNMEIWIHRRANERIHLVADNNGVILNSNSSLADAGTNVSEVLGKDLSQRIYGREGEDATIYAGRGKEYAAKEIAVDGLRIGGEGMRGFYDQMLPSFVKKYTKKWGAEVGEVTMPDLEENNTMHAVNVTDSMRESVMQGQPKFSLPSLVGVHNLSLDKLRKVIKMGGLANPSVAVIDVGKQTHDDYGEYSLILPKNMIDARQGKNAGTWAGDAWTPTYPQVVKRMNDDKAISRFYKDIDALPEAMRSRVRLDFDSFMDGRSANALAYWYLFEKGNAPEMVLVPSRYSNDVTNAVSEATKGSFSMFNLTPEERAKCLDAYIAVKFDGDRAAFEAEMQTRIERLAETIETKKSDRVKKWAQDTIDSIKEYGFDYDDVAKFIRDVEYDAREKGKVNVDATITAARERIKANDLEADYDTWRNNLDERYGIEEYIFDGYTNSGNRRYLPHTVENASKWMKKQGRQGAVATFPSFGTFVAVSIPKMTTLESIRKRKALLGKSKEEYDAFREKWENVYYELGKKLQPDAKSFEDYGYWRLIEAVGQENPKEFIKKEYGVELSEVDMTQLNEMLNAIRTEYPARYFETKFERPLQLSDFTAAVVPNDIPLDVESRLKDANVEVIEYEKGDNASRAEAMQKASQMENVRFSLQETLITPEMDAAYLDAVERGDMATAQRMVMEAAMLAMPNTKVVDEDGNPKVVYHQTNATVYINRETGQNWDELDWRERMEWDERDDWDDYWEEQEFNTFSRVNARTTQELDGFFFAPEYDEYHEYGDRTIEAFLDIENPASREDYNIDSSQNNAGRDERIRLQNEGYDGVIREEDGTIWEYVAFSPNQIKSAAPVTYDDAGNVIPLSERFNPRKEDIRYSIIGEIGAANLDTYGRYGSPMLALEMAREFEAEGKTAREIRLATNWERGKDGKWRYEIMDGVYHHPQDDDITAKEYRLADIFDNPDLYKAYPYLKDIKVEYKPKMKSRGTYYNGVIELNASRTPEQINSTLLHEVQHAIQHIEMFARGGNTDMFKDQEVIDQLMREIEALGEDFRNTSNANIIRKAYLIYQLVKRGLNKDSIDSKAFKAYRRLAGEVESRNVQKRMGMTEAQRLETLLSATEDVARKDQEMLFDEYEESEARYSIVDMPFFNDENGEVIYFDNTDVAQDFVEDDAPRQVVRRDVTEEVVRAYLKGKYLTRKERIRKEARQQIAVARQLYKEADIRRREGIESQRSNAGKVEYILGDIPYESLGFEDMALVAIAEGDVKIRWEDDGTRRGLASELGLSDGERKSYGQITKGATLTFEAFVHKWWESLGGYEKGIDTQDLRNALIEALMAANTANRALEILRKKYDHAEEEMNNAIYDIESERDRLLAAEDAAYAEQERELQNPATMRYYVESYASNILFTDDLNTISHTIREMGAKIRAAEEKVAEARSSREKRTEAIREMQESLAEAKDVLLEALSTYENLGFGRAEVQRLVDAVKGARTLRDISKVRTKVESILLNASIREKRNMMNKLIQLRLPNGELLETFVGTMVHDNRMSATEGKRIISDMWKGQNAKGVSVAKMVDDDTRILLENIRGMVMAIHKGHFVKEEVDGEEVRRYIPAAENTMDIPSSLEANEKRVLELIEKEIGGTITAEERTELEARSVYPAYLFVVLGKQNVAQKRKEIEELFERIKARREGDYTREEREQDYAMLEQLQREHNECKKLYEQALDDFNDSINNIIIGGRVSLREFRENKEKHKAEVIRMAIDAMGIEDKDINTAQPTRTEEAMAKYWRGLLNITYWTFNTTLREIDRNAPNGEGKFYKYIMGRYVKAVNGLQVRTEQHIETLGDAVRDIWYRGEKISPQEALKKVMEKADATSLGIIMRYKVGEKKETPVVRQLRISNGLFVLAMWGQEQYRTIMMKHGIDEDFIADVESRIREIDERYLILKDWVIKTMLPATREEYNKTHVELFGASMDNIANYFPAKVMEGYREVDMSKAESGLPSTMTGSIIKRQPHNNMIDAAQSFFSVLLGHLQNMDHWASFSPLIEDINAILSNNDFKNRANTLFPGTDANRGGAGSLVQILKDTAAIAMDCYRVKHAAVDELLGMMAGAWTASNISWRLSTAIKQLSGSVAFLTSEIDGVTQIMWLKNMATLIDAMKWASEMSPMFRKRWNGRFAGNEVLQQYAATQSKGMDLRKGKTSRAIDNVEDFIRFLTLELGMLPNAAVDAVVVATGMKTIYDATLRKVTNGKPETATKEQKDIAMMKAEIFANETQQSAEGAYLSVPQAQKSAATTMATTYMNASYAANRMLVGGAQEVIRAIRAKENPMSGVPRLLTGLAIPASFVAMTYLGRGLWNIILDAIDYEDDDESQINWKDYGIDVAISLGTGGILGGNIIQSLVSGYGVTALPAATEFFKDLGKATGISAKDIAKIKNGGVYGEDWKIDISLYAIGNILLKYRYGVDAETYVNMVRGVENICRDGDPLGTLQIINSPASTVNILVGRRRKGETVKEYVERRMRYEVIGKVPDFEDIYDEEIHYIGDGILDRVGGARDYKLRGLYKEFAERQYNAVYNKMLTAAERAEYEILEKEYLEVCEALGWKPDRQPTLDTTKVDIPPQYAWKYHKAKGIATEMNKMRINMDRFVGTDSTYLEMLKARQAKKRELIETYNEYLR